jgi:hypothetical protein
MHHSSQAKIDAALAKRPPGLDQMALPDLRDTVGKALGDQLTDLEEKFAGPSPRSKGQRVTQLDPENQHLVVKVHENPNKACKATGTTIGQLLKNANRGNITLYSKTLTKKVCFRYATEEEAASIAPSVDSKSAAKAAFEAVVNRPSNKRHSKDAVPVTQLDPKNQGAYVCTFGSITIRSSNQKSRMPMRKGSRTPNCTRTAPTARTRSTSLTRWSAGSGTRPKRKLRRFRLSCNSDDED